MEVASPRVSKLFFSLLVVSLLTLFCVLGLNEYQKALFAESNSIRNPLVFSVSDADLNTGEVLTGMVLTRHTPKKMARISKESCLFEFDKAWFGTAEVMLKEGVSAGRVVIRFGELLKDGRVFKPDDIRFESVAYYEAELTLSDTHSRTIQIKLPTRELPANKILPFGLSGVMPFRYVEIVSGCDLVSSENVKQVALTYSFSSEKSKFESDNQILDEVYDLAKHTIQATSFAGLYVDGYRELKPYEADAYITQLGHYAIDPDPGMARRTQEFLLSNGTWPTEWAMHSIFMAYQDYMQTGDKAFLLAHFEKLKARTLMDFSNDDDLISSHNQTKDFLDRAGISAEQLIDVIDWPRGERSGFYTEPIDSVEYLLRSIKIAIKEARLKVVELLGLRNAAAVYAVDISNLKSSLTKFPAVNTVVNAFHYEALNKMAYLASEIGKHAEAKIFKDRAEVLKRRIQETLFDSKRGLFVDAPGVSHVSKHSNVFALKFGLVPSEAIDSVIRFIESNDEGSVYLHQYVLEALFEHGRSDTALKILTRQDERGWHSMIHGIGSSLTTESWNFDVNPGMDLNHAWATAPVNIIPRYIAGVRPVEPRYRKFNVMPNDAEMRFFNAEIPTMDGSIVLDMRRESNNLTYRLSFPAEKMADLFLLKPDCKQFNVKLNNQDIEVRYSNEERIEIKDLPSGQHQIQMQCSAPEVTRKEAA